MIDRAANANFLAGGVFGGALLVAAAVLALVIFIPIGHSDWGAFVRGAITMPATVVAVLVVICAVIWATAR